MEDLITIEQAEQRGFLLNGDGILSPAGTFLITPELMQAWLAKHGCSQCVVNFDRASVDALDRLHGRDNAPPLFRITEDVREIAL